jgi:NTE family protein
MPRSLALRFVVPFVVPFVVLGLLACTAVRPRLALGQTSALLAEPPAGSARPAGPPPSRLSAPPRTRIGLVLSGGGARGAAHVGVLRVLEELRIPIDFVAGTSMGAIVGAAYASGMSVAEMREAIAPIRTDRLFRDQPPRQDQAFRRKQEDLLPLFAGEVGLSGGGLSLPKGAVSGIALESVLRTLVKTRAIDDFDRLPIPFRAVATDIETGEMVVFASGELTSAMRASMSVPGAIAPAEIGGRMLIDGGLVRNLPIDVARGMGADVVIAVNLGTPLLRRDQIRSVVGVSAQMINILTEQNVQRSLRTLTSEDVLISPELGDFSAGDFDNLPKAVAIGERAARAAAAQLAQFSLSPEDFALEQARRAGPGRSPGAPLDEVRFAGLERVNPDTLRAEIDTRAGAPLDQATLDRDIRRLYGRGDFEHVGYTLDERDGRRVLTVQAVEKSWGPNYLRFGLGLSTDFAGVSYFNLLATHRSTWLNALGAEWRNEFQVGRTMRAVTEWYQPLDATQRFFVAPRLSVEQTPIDFYDQRLRVASYRTLSSKASLDVGTQFTKFGELRLGVERGLIDYSRETGTVDGSTESARFHRGGASLRLRLDQLDSVVLPRSGYAGTLGVFASRRALGADSDHSRWEGEFTGATSIGPHIFQVGFAGGGRLGSAPLPIYDGFQWGGFLRQSGYKTGQLYGRDLVFGRLVYVNRWLQQTFLEGAYAGFSLEAGEMRDQVLPNARGVMKSASLFVVFDSPLGPMYFAYGQAADGNRAVYLFLGRP